MFESSKSIKLMRAALALLFYALGTLYVYNATLAWNTDWLMFSWYFACVVGHWLVAAVLCILLLVDRSRPQASYYKPKIKPYGE